MIPPINCPYKGLTAPPCWSCVNHMHETDDCWLNHFSVVSVNNTGKATDCDSTYEERIKRYENDRAKLLELSKESLVDLILKRPEY